MGPYQVTAEYSPHQLDQTDFGRIYYSLPQQVLYPSTVKELSAMLKSCQAKKSRVTIRNTGHSVNGQTLTDATQICLERLDHCVFDEKKLTVTCGSGASWDKVLTTIGFPRYCTPIFPNNAGQQIHIGGSASVGGAGAYLASNGGLWNHVLSLKLATMNGDVLTCSRDQNTALFSYALGGFGRIGVIAELTVRVVESHEQAIVLILVYHTMESYCRGLQLSHHTQWFDGILGQTQLNKTAALRAIGLKPHYIALVREIRDPRDVEASLALARTFGSDAVLSIKEGDAQGFPKHAIDFSTSMHMIHKRNIVYWHPDYTHLGVNELEHCHPWSDYIVPPAAYPAFMEKLESLLIDKNVAKHVLREGFFNNHFDVDMVGTYCARSFDGDFPLSLDIKTPEGYYFCIGLYFTVPPEQLHEVLPVINELTAYVYSVGGKRYLYGRHELTAEQVERQYTAPVLGRWKQLKRRLDPAGLLNKGVIPHLD